MTEYTPTTDEVREAYVVGVDPVVTARYRAEFDRWLAETIRAAKAAVLEDAANELAGLDDGGKRGLQGHSKSHASVLTHRHAVGVLRASAAEYRKAVQ